MIKRFLTLVAIVPLIAAYAPPVQAKKKKQKSDELVFPRPPDVPRIQFIRSIKTTSDLTGKSGAFFGKLTKALAGGDVSTTIFSRPYGIAVQGEKILVADSEGNAVILIDLKKKKWHRVGFNVNARFKTPIGVAFDSEGNIYASDSNEGYIKSFSSEGKLRWRIEDFGEEIGKLKRPTGLMWSPKNELIVADAGNRRLLVLNSKGEYKRTIPVYGDDGKDLAIPANIWVEKDGGIIVSDPLMARIKIYSGEEKFVFGFGEPGDKAGYFARPRGIASDSDGNIYVVDALSNQIQMFNREGQLLMYFGGFGEGPAEFSLPSSIFITPDDRIYISDSHNGRIQIFQYLKEKKKEQ